MGWRAAWLGLLLAAGAGCESARLEKFVGSGDVLSLRIEGKVVEAELALDEATRTKGLMNRPSLPDNRGMLFIYPREKLLSFWMKNTLIPLSIAFIDDDGRILQIEDMRPQDLSSIRSKEKVRHALEMNQGWFQKNGLRPGATFVEFRKSTQGLEAHGDGRGAGSGDE